MATGTKFNCFVENVCEGVHNFASHTLKIALTNSAPNVSTNTVLADITQIVAGNGYTAGGSAVTVSSSSQTAGTYKLVLADLVFTASGGTMATFRYAVLYNDTATGDPLIAYWDAGSGVSLASTETYTLDFSATNGALTLA